MDAERGIEANSNSILERVQAAGDELGTDVQPVFLLTNGSIET